MSGSRSGKPDPDLERVELLFHQKGRSASFGAKVALSLNRVDPSCINSITWSTCRAKCANILHDSLIPTIDKLARSVRSERPSLFPLLRTVIAFLLYFSSHFNSLNLVQMSKTVQVSMLQNFFLRRWLSGQISWCVPLAILNILV